MAIDTQYMYRRENVFIIWVLMPNSDESGAVELPRISKKSAGCHRLPLTWLNSRGAGRNTNEDTGS